MKIKSSTNHLWDKEWEFGGSVSGFVISHHLFRAGGKQIKQRKQTNNNNKNMKYSQKNHFPEHKGWEDFLTIAIFQEHWAQAKFNVVSAHGLSGLGIQATHSGSWVIYAPWSLGSRQKDSKLGSGLMARDWSHLKICLLSMSGAWTVWPEG